ncbi:hypothetical protein PQG02_12005 [Nostoc sp. UHCC 0926]|uniref:hypothetical protein n=1 Tax=unclassified Nostoc TaxID=2593658 RepID=UPI0023603876|nr:hypothetical protein [Nostoc sp. UHCC 0926]WDD34986.1 hypothetical protein PQG02_12005 [Nostoc sp. UHCC 0926]
MNINLSITYHAKYLCDHTRLVDQVKRSQVVTANCDNSAIAVIPNQNLTTGKRR